MQQQQQREISNRSVQQLPYLAENSLIAASVSKSSSFDMNPLDPQLVYPVEKNISYWIFTYIHVQENDLLIFI